jgi:hypothetical protein
MTTHFQPERLAAEASGSRRPAAEPAQRARRKEQVLTQHTASIVRSISDAVVAKDGEPFFLCPPDGQIDCSGTASTTTTAASSTATS